MKKVFYGIITYGVSAGILAYLVVDAQRSGVFAQLAEQPKNWPLLILATVLGFAAVLLTIVRWYILVRALGIPFHMREALRLGFLGYLFNFISLGSVGGDLFKAVFVAREKPGKRAEVVASVAVDRIMGLYGLFMLASVAILATREYDAAAEDVRLICQLTLVFTCVGTLIGAFMLLPFVSGGKFSDMLAGLPKVGDLLGRLIEAFRIYRRRLDVLFVSILLSIGVQTLFVFCVYLTARGLPGESPTLAAHFTIVPLAFVTGLLPLPANGLGAFEATLDFLYRHISGGVATSPGKGFLVALGYRAVTILIAIVGGVIYFFSRGEVKATLRTAEQIEQAAHARKSDHHTAAHGTETPAA